MLTIYRLPGRARNPVPVPSGDGTAFYALVPLTCRKQVPGGASRAFALWAGWRPSTASGCRSARRMQDRAPARSVPNNPFGLLHRQATAMASRSTEASSSGGLATHQRRRLFRYRNRLA
ncbi:hypothetical protein Maq22A_1p38500 (plasmid) [Methylobacterium aquaticum]|uniref:Uncharacterized protein n=1 Tax=Methylobacterium aquaticum TaxID=270351 RepID=A0A1Y0Z938_9HYPH|nr:hypothetical protein Maq22A_1p38500 [Methylobacterium aquaticum]